MSLVPVTPGKPLCRYCQRPIEPDERRDQRIEGWERIAGVRSSGKHGGSDVYLRERKDEFAHVRCVDLLRQGINVEQLTLA